jgi:hypothetical protein
MLFRQVLVRELLAGIAERGQAFRETITQQRRAKQLTRNPSVAFSAGKVAQLGPIGDAVITTADPGQGHEINSPVEIEPADERGELSDNWIVRAVFKDCPGGKEDRFPRRHSDGLSAAGEEAAPGPQSRQQADRGAVQGSFGGL